MRAAPAVEIVAPTPARVAFLLTDYAHIVAEPARLDPLLDWVASRIGGDKLADWRMKVAAGDWPGFVTAVLEDHYDPAYDRSSVQRSRNRLGAFAVNTLDLKTIDSLAQELAEMNIPTNAT
jgi:tRNA 2-selenouridine synthase